MKTKKNSTPHDLKCSAQLWLAKCSNKKIEGILEAVIRLKTICGAYRKPVFPAVEPPNPSTILNLQFCTILCGVFFSNSTFYPPTNKKKTWKSWYTSSSSPRHQSTKLAGLLCSLHGGNHLPWTCLPSFKTFVEMQISDCWADYRATERLLLLSILRCMQNQAGLPHFPTFLTWCSWLNAKIKK